MQASCMQGFPPGQDLRPVICEVHMLHATVECCWECTTVHNSACMGMLRKQVLQPGIELAEQGFPVSPVTAYHWKACAGALAM